jgi:hypothetical protein
MRDKIWETERDRERKWEREKDKRHKKRKLETGR